MTSSPIEGLLKAARLEVRTAQALARVDSALRLSAKRKKERWDVDLALPRFTWREGDTVLFEGPCQLIGTWVDGDGFQWGFENSSVCGTGTAQLRPRLEALHDVRPALATRAFAATRDEAVLLCASLAARTGYTGSFAGPTGKAVTFLAVQLTEPEGGGLGAGGWCSWCGALRHMRSKLIAGPDGVMICDQCGAVAAEIAAVDASYHPSLRFCVFCLEAKGSLIMGPHAGICRECARLVGNIIREHACG
jgi:hypothetical protein